MSPPPTDNSITAAAVFASPEPTESESEPTEAAGLPNDLNTLWNLEGDSNEESVLANEN